MPWNKDGTRKDSAFYLRSGNATPFKEMGSSPLKQDEVIKNIPKRPGLDISKQEKTNIEKPYSEHMFTTNLPGGGQKYGPMPTGGSKEEGFTYDKLTKSDLDRMNRESGGKWDWRSPAKQKINSNSWLTEHGKKVVETKLAKENSNFKKMQKYKEATKNYNRIKQLKYGKGSTYVYTGNPNVPSGGVTYKEAMMTRPNDPFSKAKTKLSTQKPSITSKVRNTLGKVGKVMNWAAPPLALYDFYKRGKERGTLNTSRISQKTLNKMRSYGTNKGFNF